MLQGIWYWGHFLYYQGHVIVIDKFHIWHALREQLLLLFEMRCAICHHLHNLKNVKNTHGGVLILVKLQASTCNFIKINTPPWVFSRFLSCTNGNKSRNAPHFNLGAGSATFESLREDPVCPPPSKKKINIFSVLFFCCFFLFLFCLTFYCT